MNNLVRYTVRLSPQAEAQILEHHDWLVRQDNLNADRWMTRIEAAICELEIWPQAHPVAEESSDLLFPVRRMTYGLHVVLFRIHEDRKEVEIAYVAHGARRR